MPWVAMEDALTPPTLEDLLPLVHLLISRLERLSADSYWAHQASGVRGALLRRVEAGDVEDVNTDLKSLAQLIDRGFELLACEAKSY